MIREATVEDIPQLLEYSRNFYAVSGYADYVAYTDEAMEETLRAMMERDDAVVLVAEGGYALAVCYRMYFSPDMAVQELLWWVEPEKRGQGTAKALKRGLEAWARSQGAKLVGMSVLQTSPEHITESYRRDGYEPAERSFIRRL